VLSLTLLVGVAGAGIVGWFVSGMVTRRIERVSKAIREVSPTRLDTRIDLPAGNDEIGRMTADVNQMLRRLEVAFRSQERFMTEVSHELKTPLAALLTEAQVLKYAHADGERHHRFVLSVEEEMRRLSKVVESFLMLARFGHGRQFYAESIVSLNDVALDAAEHAGLLARQSGVQVTLQLHDPGPAGLEPLIRGDMELMRIVADNLLRNAIQFSKRGGRVTIRVTCDDGGVLLQVRDQGPGVPEEYLDKIFDRFAQAPGSPGVRQGTGLGLAIARGIIDLHRGSIAAENHAEGGCLFTVRLTRASVSDTTLSEATPAPRTEPPAAEPATIT
jgi:signal transduction histidine kinase